MRERKIIVQPRFWLFLMVLFLLVFTPLYLMLDAESQRLEDRRAELAVQREALSEELKALKNDLNYARSDQGIEQFAREAGMIMPGEVRYGIGTQKD